MIWEQKYKNFCAISMNFLYPTTILKFKSYFFDKLIFEVSKSITSAVTNEAITLGRLS
jgi:hypothetical protein